MTLAGEVTSCFGEADINAFEYFYSVGSVCTDDCAPKLSLSRYLLGSVIVGFNTSCFSLVSGITSNCLFVSYVNIYEQQSYSNAYVKNKSLDVLAKQNRKGKTHIVFVKMICIDFRRWAIIGIFVQGG